MKSLLKIFVAVLFLTNSAQLVSQENPSFKKGSTLKLSFVQGADNFGDLTEYNTQLIADVLGGKVGGVSFTSYNKYNFGAGFSWGSMYFINAIDVLEKFRLGVDVTWMGVKYGSVSHNILAAPGESFDMHHIYAAPEIGPSISWAPIERLAIDVSFKAIPTFAAQFGQYSTTAIGNVKLDNKMAAYGFGFRYGPAVYLRFKPLLVGVQYNMGSIEQDVETTSESQAIAAATATVTSGGTPSTTSLTNKYTNTSSFETIDFIIGLKF